MSLGQVLDEFRARIALEKRLLLAEGQENSDTSTLLGLLQNNLDVFQRTATLRTNPVSKHSAFLSAPNSNGTTGLDGERIIYQDSGIKVVWMSEGRQFIANSKRLDLTPSEYRILADLVTHTDEIRNRHTLEEVVMGHAGSDDSRSIDAHVQRLRRKLEKVSPALRERLTTVRGFGYTFSIMITSST